MPPVGDGPWPGVVVLHEAFGLIDDIRQQADRLAASGYLAVAPDLYSAGGAVRCIRATFRSLMSGRGGAFDDIEAVRGWLRERPDCTGRVGVIGFCMGGGFALMTARDFDVSAANYAHLPKDLDAVLRGACPIVASYGGKDRTLRGTAAELESALERAGVAHDVKEYPGAGHSFLNSHPFGPAGALLRVAGVGYHGPSAEDAWRRILRFFDAQLGDQAETR
ncbi:MAG: carboxymethylenebutenolidase [Solirubrobacteraceae bacterium]|nr:carboxymethylenebutenolidase [Solirubrobacteraceae bacterium]